MKHKLLVGFIFLWMIPLANMAQQIERYLSLEQSAELMQQNNPSLQISGKGVQWATAERDRMRSFWYPNINASGAYVHMSNKIEVKESLNQLTDPAKDFIHTILPNDQLITSILDQIGKQTFAFGLMPSNLTTVDANLSWPIFTGGKRIYASKMGQKMISISQVEHKQVDAVLQTELVVSYFAVRLGDQVVQVRKRAYDDLLQHYEDAVKMEQNGILTKADRLFAQVTMEEAKRELSAANRALYVAQQSLRTVINSDSTEKIKPTTPLFINHALPSLDYFKTLLPTQNNLVNKLDLQRHMAHDQLQIDRASYLPNIALFAKQTLYSNGIPKNLLPRTMVGVAFTWNLFDGLEREKRIRQTKITTDMLSLTKQKALSDIALAMDGFYSQIQNALSDIASLTSTTALGDELVRMRKKAFLEGMATSTDVIDAEVMRSKVHIASLMAYYEYDVALINLLALCGITQQFVQYQQTGTVDETINTNN